jgi:hypothetical protein
VAIGIRTMALGVDVQATVRDAQNRVVRTARRRFGANRLIQESAQQFLGASLGGGESIAVTVISGSGIVYAASGDNATSTPHIDIVGQD